MAKRKLKKRNYTGVGYVHAFKHNSSGSMLYEPCTQAEYERMGEKGGSRHNPTKPGYTWQFSAGGTIAVDTPDTMLGDNEYVVLPDKELVKISGMTEDKAWKELPKGTIKRDEVDLALWQ